MTITEMEAFLTVYRTRSLSKAAEEIHISQSSLSVRLMKLEEELGCRLFERGKGIKEAEATEAGRKLYPLAVDYVELNRKIRTVAEPETLGPLRVSVNNSLATCMLSPVFEEYLMSEDGEEYSTGGHQLEIQDMVSKNAQPYLLGGMLDLALATDPCQSRELVIRPVVSERMVIVLSGKLPDQLGVDENAFRRYEELDPRREVYVSWNESVDNWHRRIFGDHAVPGITVSVIDQLRFFLEQKSSWAVVPYTVGVYLSASPSIHMYRLESTLPWEVAPRRITYANYPRRRLNDSRIRAFLSCLQNYLADFKEDDIRFEK